jgi:pyruvoyl-dependent arginine decarboxylase (PvlArgDC)
MNTDKATTFIGLVVGVMVATKVVTQDQGATLTSAFGIILGIAISLWGYFTNKGGSQ